MGKENHGLARSQRLKQAKRWIKNTGVTKKGMVSKYAKKFKVSKECAIKELAMIGMPISKEYKEALQRTEAARIAKRKEKREAKQLFEQCDFDETFAFIVDYTSGGVTYGTTWAELGLEPFDFEGLSAMDNDEDYGIDEEDLPF